MKAKRQENNNGFSEEEFDSAEIVGDMVTCHDTLPFINTIVLGICSCESYLWLTSIVSFPSRPVYLCVVSRFRILMPKVFLGAITMFRIAGLGCLLALVSASLMEL